MFGLFKKKVTKYDYGAILVRQALQYIDEASTGISLIVRANPESIKQNIDIDNDIPRIVCIQCTTCIAVAEVSLHAMGSSGMQIYEIRTGYINHLNELINGWNDMKGIGVNIDCLSISHDISIILSTNALLSCKGIYYSGGMLSREDVYGKITEYVFSRAVDWQDVDATIIYNELSRRGALKFISGMDRSARFVSQMYNSYRLM